MSSAKKEEQLQEQMEKAEAALRKGKWFEAESLALHCRLGLLSTNPDPATASRPGTAARAARSGNPANHPDEVAHEAVEALRAGGQGPGGQGLGGGGRGPPEADRSPRARAERLFLRF